MNADTIITMLLIVAAIVAGFMSYIAHQKVPGQTEYQAPPRASASNAGEWPWEWRGDPLHGYRHQARDGLGREGSPYRHRHNDRSSGLGRDDYAGYARRTAGDGLGRGYDRGHGDGYDRRQDRPRYHANGSSTHDRRDQFEEGPDNGFEAWARAHGFRWHDGTSQPPPPPPPPPAAPHWSKVLDISRTAGAKEIRTAYANTMRRLHPDVAGQDPLTSQRCTEARVAYEQAKQDAQTNGRP